MGDGSGTAAQQGARSVLTETLERVSALDDYFAIERGAPAEAGWANVAELFAGPNERLGQVLADTGRAAHTDDLRIAASYLLIEYVWRIAGLLAGCHLAAGRVPDVAVADASVRLDADARIMAFAIATDAFAARPDDDEARACGAQLLDEPRLRRLVLEVYERHMAHAIAGLRAHSPLGERAHWAIATDSFATAYLYFGKLLGDADRAASEAQATLASIPDSPLRSRTQFLAVEHVGRCELFMRRGSCCIGWRAPDHGYCFDCPLLPQDGWLRRVHRAMEHPDDPGALMSAPEPGMTSA